MYLTALIISNPVLASNNRGEANTLQQISTPSGTRTVLSGYSTKHAIRDSMIAQGARLWRRNDNAASPANPAGYVYGDNDSSSMAKAIPPTPSGYADEEFGFMVAEKGKGEQATKKKGNFECSIAISTTDYPGDNSFVQGLKAADPQLNPFSAERHFTRYQFTVTWNLPHFDAESFKYMAEALRSLPVGGSHSSNATEITPDKIIWCLHKVGGRSGLQCGVGLTFSPTEELDVSRIVEKTLELGISIPNVNTGGTAITEMIKAALPYCKKRV